MKTSTLVTFILTILIFLISLIISPFYTGGDQNSYIRVYSALSELSLLDGYHAYYLGLSSKEPVAFFFTWISSHFLGKHEFVAFFNSILVFSTMRLLLKWRASPFVAALITSTNFYFYVLYFAAERLKFGFIFLFISLIYSHRKRFFVFSSASVMSHAQIFIVYISMLFVYLIEEVKKIIKGEKLNKAIIVAFIFIGISTLVMSEQILTKFTIYFAQKKTFSIMDISKLLVFFLFSVFYTKERVQAFSFFLPLFVVALLLGGDRVNLYGYFVFLYYAVRVNRGLNIGIAITSIYFAYKTFIFLSKVFIYSNGFTSLKI